MDPSESPKTYWAILETFLNKKKIPRSTEYFTKTSLSQILKNK